MIMKQIYFMFITAICVNMATYAQENNPVAKNGKTVFTAGISYSYMTADLRLSELSKHSIWYGTDYGTYVLNKDELKEVNDHIERKNTVNNINLEFGFNLFDHPDSKWEAGISFLAGLARNNTTIYNTVTDTNEYQLNSKLIKPFMGVGFDLSYAIDDRWGLSMKPYFVCTFGQAEEITDNINVAPEGFIQTTTDSYRSFYQRFSLMATYTAGDFVFSAGPGLYLLVSHHEYEIRRIYESNGDLLLDVITSRGINRWPVDASLSGQWNFAGPFYLYVFSGIGADIIVNGGLRVNF